MSGTHHCQIFDYFFFISAQSFVCGFLFHLYSHSISTLFLFRFYFHFISESVLELYGILAHEVRLGPNILFHLQSG